MVFLPAGELNLAGGIVGAAALYGGYKAVGAAATGVSRRASEVQRDMKTSSELGKVKAEQKKSAKDRQARIKELVKLKEGKKK